MPSFRGLIGASGTVGVLRAVGRRLARSRGRRGQRQDTGRQRRREAFTRQEELLARGANRNLQNAPEYVRAAKRRQLQFQREVRRERFEQRERQLTRKQERTIAARVGKAISSVFNLFGLGKLANLVRDNSKGLTFGDVIRKVVSSKLVQAYAAALAYNKFSGTPQPPDRVVEVVSLRAQERIGERWLQVARQLCPSDTGKLRRSLQIVILQRGDQREMAIRSPLPYFETINAETGFVSHAWQAIRRDIPTIVKSEIRRADSIPVNRKVRVRMPDLVRVETTDSLRRTSRKPRIIQGKAVSV